MTLGSDIQQLSIRCQTELDARYDYFEHTKTVWDFFQGSVARQGRTVVCSKMR